MYCADCHSYGNFRTLQNDYYLFCKPDKDTQSLSLAKETETKPMKFDSQIIYKHT